MKNNKFKKVDYIIIAFVAVVAVAIVAIYFFASKQGDYVSVKVSGKEVATFKLGENTEYVIQGYNNGHNTLVIKNNQAYIKYANCPDKLCKKQGHISKVGESLICLPNKVVVQIESENNKPEVDAVVK